MPAGLPWGEDFNFDAIDGAGGHAQLAACAIDLVYGVHGFIAADDGIHRAGLHAQGAAYAPVFINKGDGALLFAPKFGVEWQFRLARDGG